jgi:hypothetical protein
MRAWRLRRSALPGPYRLLPLFFFLRIIHLLFTARGLRRHLATLWARGIRNESEGGPPQTKEACALQGSRGHKDLKVGVVEVTEEVEHILDTGVGCPMEATSKDFTTQNEKFAKMAIKSESKSQILLNPDTNIYCSMEVVGGSNISQSQSLHAGVLRNRRYNKSVSRILIHTVQWKLSTGTIPPGILLKKGLSIFWIPRFTVQWKSFAEMGPLSIQFIAWTPVSAF